MLLRQAIRHMIGALILSVSLTLQPRLDFGSCNLFVMLFCLVQRHWRFGSLPCRLPEGTAT